jgi:hypothetical protein
MMDIVKRLRVMAPEKPQLLIWGERSSRDLNADIREAADTIEALCEALRKLTDAAGTAVHFKHQQTNAMLELETANKAARAALAKAGAQ